MPLARLREEARAAVALNRGLGASMELGETEILVQNMAQWCVEFEWARAANSLAAAEVGA
jgi:hypothetical protein